MFIILIIYVISDNAKIYTHNKTLRFGCGTVLFMYCLRNTDIMGFFGERVTVCGRERDASEVNKQD